MDKRTGRVEDYELLSPEDGLDAMYSRFQDLLIKGYPEAEISA